MSKLEDLRFYSTPEHPCSYLEDKVAKTVFVDPEQHVDDQVFYRLSELGFRRSGTHIYRPHCDLCQSCVSIRIITADFIASKSQKRIINKNKDLTIVQAPKQFTDEYYDLYERYINTRHVDGDMYPPSQEQFKSFLVSTNQSSSFFEFRDTNNILVAVSSMDFLHNGMSAVYTFFDPHQEKRSLGSFAILWQIAENNRRQLDYLYLGYWVKECQKMNYKIKYKPLELLIEGRWLQAN